MKKIIAFLFSLNLMISYSQEQCLSTKIIQDQIHFATDSQTVIDEINALLNINYTPSKIGAIIKIPIVFHIFHNGDAEGTDENLSDSIILEQLERINTDFRAKNIDTANVPNEFKPLISDTKIEFCLAKKDTNGSFTNGIIRHQFTQEGFDEDTINNFIKHATIWNRNRYLNVWIFKFAGSLATNNVNGYATPPFGSTNILEDGVVLNYTKVGNDLGNDIGRTLVHEIGHWLGLYHIWGILQSCANDDGISDTPEQEYPHQNCPSTTIATCGTNDMYVNFMDYTDADCSLMFTNEQSNKMHSVLDNFRLNITESDACIVKDLIVKEIIFPRGTVCQETIIPAIAIKNIGNGSLSSYGFEYYIDNIFQESTIVNNIILPDETKYLHLNAKSFASNSNHTIQFKVISQDIAEYDLNNTKTTTFATVYTGNGFSSLNNDFEGINFPPTNFFIYNEDNDTSWQRFSGSNNKVAFINNNSLTKGNKDAISTTDIDVFSISDANPFLNFDYLYKAKTGFSDTLTVFYSIDCGAHWFPIWEKEGLELSNQEIESYPFIYTNESFQNVSLELFSILDINTEELKKIRFKFENKSGGGNNLYLDNINISFELGIKNLDNLNITTYPNPTNDFINIIQKDQSKLKIEILDFSGKIIISNIINKENNILFIKDLKRGIYFMKITKDNKYLVRKIIKQ